jgi:hypothetical protein
MKFALIHSIKGFSRLTMICVERHRKLFNHPGEFEWDAVTIGDCPLYLAQLLNPSLVHKITLDVLTPHSIYISGAEYPGDEYKWHSTVLRSCEAIAMQFGERETDIVEIGEVDPLNPAAVDDSPGN